MNTSEKPLANSKVTTGWQLGRVRCRQTPKKSIPTLGTPRSPLLAIFMLIGCGPVVGEAEGVVRRLWPDGLDRLAVATVSLIVAAIIIFILALSLSKKDVGVRELVSQRFAYFMLICVFIIGFYGAIAALLATSWLQANDISDSHAESIMAEIGSAIPPAPTTQIDRIIENFDDDPPRFDELRDQIRALPDEDARRALIEWQTVEEAGFDNFVGAVRAFKAQYIGVLEANNKFVTESVPGVLLNSAYDARQRRIYRLNVGSYQKKITKAIDVATQTITTEVRTINTESRAALQRMSKRLESYRQGTDVQVIIGDVSFFGQRSRMVQRFDRAAHDTMPALMSTIPKPVEPGLLENWGELGSVIGWLIRPSSTDVLYIVGMVGFGILGSSLTTFVSASARKLGNPNLKDVIAVVIKGTTAAMVVYLFIFGGFEVFSNADVAPFTPNVYMLFLTCFLGAVFSDRIWRYAELRLIKQLRGGRSLQTPTRPE